MQIHELAVRVGSKDDLIAFVRALVDDHKTRPSAWENSTLDQYLSALASWLEDSEGYYRNQGLAVPVTPPWRNIADMLIAASMYE
jgi:hypothetical protein